MELLFILVIGWLALKTAYREPAWKRSLLKANHVPCYSLRLDSGSSMDEASRNAFRSLSED